MRYRVLHIINSLNMGGAENFIMNIYRNIDKMCVQFDFLVHKQDYFDKEVLELGGKIHYLEGYVNEVGVLRYKTLIRDFFQTKEGKIYKIVHLHVNQTSGLIIPIIKETSKAICFSHSHDLRNYNNFLVSGYKKYLQMRLNKYTDYRLACSQAAGEWLFGKNSFDVINNGIDVEKFAFSSAMRSAVRKELDISDNTIVVGHVGRFEPVKNQIFLIELFEMLQPIGNYKLILIGEGSLKSELQKRVREKGLNEYIYFLPTTSEVAKYYSAMDLFVLPSTQEALGIVGIEAQANGLPVLASTNTSKEMKVSKNVVFLDLCYEKWKKALAEFRKTNVKMEERKAVKINEDYDIRNSMKKLIALYNQGVEQYEDIY